MEINPESGDQSVWHHNGHSLYDITMSNDVARDGYCEITMGNGVVVLLGTSIVMS